MLCKQDVIYVLLVNFHLMKDSVKTVHQENILLQPERNSVTIADVVKKRMEIEPFVNCVLQDGSLQMMDNVNDVL